MKPKSTKQEKAEKAAQRLIELLKQNATYERIKKLNDKIKEEE